MSAVETHAVEFGEFGKDYEEAAEKIGISKQGVFILAAFADLVKSGDIDEAPIKTASEQLLEIADEIERDGDAAADNHDSIVERLRYLAQFTLERPVPAL